MENHWKKLPVQDADTHWSVWVFIAGLVCSIVFGYHNASLFFFIFLMSFLFFIFNTKLESKISNMEDEILDLRYKLEQLEKIKE